MNVSGRSDNLGLVVSCNGVVIVNLIVPLSPSSKLEWRLFRSGGKHLAVLINA